MCVLEPHGPCYEQSLAAPAAAGFGNDTDVRRIEGPIRGFVKNQFSVIEEG